MDVLLPFLLAVLLVSATPGPAMALVLRRAALRGWRGAVPTVLGLELGLFAWALAAGAGLAALVAASEAAYLVLRVVGAGVLLWLGLRMLLASRSPAPAAPVPASRAFGEGLVVQLANPKLAVFLLALYPQFVPADGPVLLWAAGLGLLQASVETVLYTGLAVVAGRASGWLSRTAVRRRIEAASGTVLVALGVRVAAGR